MRDRRAELVDGLPASSHRRQRDLVGYGAEVPSLTWPQGRRLAINFVVNYEEGSEYSFAAGDGRNESIGELPESFPNHIPDLRIESVYEYGSRCGVWRLLTLFDQYEIS